MRGLKVFLFITFLFFGIFGLLGLFFPSLSAQIMGMTDANAAYTRVISTGAVGFAIGLWYAFRNPLKSLGLIIAAIAWLGLEALVLLISGITGGIAWGSALPASSLTLSWREG